MAQQPRFWKQLQRHPLSAEYENITGERWDGLVKSIKENGFDKSRPIILAVDPADGKEKILDGWQRQRACVEADVRPVYDWLPKGTDLDTYVQRHNDWRRHETDAQKDRRLQGRRERVAKMREQGESVRSIAEKEGVSRETIRTDVEKIDREQSESLPGDNPLSPSKNTYTETPTERERVTGRDGKSYPKTRPVILCDRCQRVGPVPNCPKCEALKTPAKNTEEPKPAKPGQARFDEKVFDQPFGQLVRAIDSRARAMGKGQLPKSGADLKDYQEALKECLSSVMRAGSISDQCLELTSVLLSLVNKWRKQ